MSARGLNAVTNRVLLQAETYARQLSHHFASSSAAAPAHERAVPTSNAAVEALRQKLAEGKSADQQQSHAAQLVRLPVTAATEKYHSCSAGPNLGEFAAGDFEAGEYSVHAPSWKVSPAGSSSSL